MIAFAHSRPCRASRSGPGTIPGDLLGREDRSLATDPLRDAGGAHDHAPEARPDRAAHVLLHRDLQERLASGRRGADGVDLAGAALATELRHAESIAAAGRQTRQGREHRRGTAGERLVRPRLVVGDQLGDVAVVTETAVVGGDDVLDLVGEQARRIDLARRCRPEQQRDLAPVADRLVGQHPDPGHPEPARDEQQMATSRVHLERPAQRTEQVDRVPGAQPGEPVGPPPDHPEMDRDDAGGGISRVDRERPPQDHPGEVPGPNVDELARSRSVRQGWSVIRLQPLARKDLPTVDQLRRSEPHGHAVGRSSASSPASVAASPSASASAGSAPPSAASSVPFADASWSSGATAGNASASVLGQVAEDIGRVVELDQLVGAAESPPLVLGVLGDHLGAEAVGRQRQSFVVVVHDDQVADDRDKASRGALELVEQACLAALAAFLVFERQVVEASGGRLVVVLGQRDRLASCPRIGCGGVRILGQRHAFVRGDARDLEQVALGGRLGGHPGGFAGGLGERRVDVGRVVELDQLRGGLDDLGLAHPFTGDVIEVAAPAAERQVGRDRQVVGLVVDQRQATQHRDAVLVMVEEAAQLFGRLDDEVRAFEGGIGCELTEQVVVARIHCLPPVWFVARWSCVASKAHRVMDGIRGQAPCAAQEHRVVAFEDPLAGSMAERAGGLVGLELVEGGVVGQVEQDHVVEIPPVSDVEPADEADPELLFVVLDLLRKDRAHEELEERVAAAANAEVGREHGHRCGPPRRTIGRALRPRLAIVARGTQAGESRSDVGGGSLSSSSSSESSSGVTDVSRASSSSPTVLLSLASGRRRPRRSAATRRRRKMIVWPVTSSRKITAKSRAALTGAGQFQTTVSGVRKMKKTRTTSWNRKHPRPGPRSGVRSSPRYWTGPVGRGRRGGVGSAFGSGIGAAGSDGLFGVSEGSAVGSVTRRNDTGADRYNGYVVANKHLDLLADAISLDIITF